MQINLECQPKELIMRESDLKLNGSHWEGLTVLHIWSLPAYLHCSEHADSGFYENVLILDVAKCLVCIHPKLSGSIVSSAVVDTTFVDIYVDTKNIPTCRYNIQHIDKRTMEK